MLSALNYHGLSRSSATFQMIMIIGHDVTCLGVAQPGLATPIEATLKCHSESSTDSTGAVTQAGSQQPASEPRSFTQARPRPSWPASAAPPLRLPAGLPAAR
jgi:hypothetical protein